MELKATSLSIEDGIGVITLNRPQRLNAWTGRMHTEYRWCLAELEQTDAARAIVITGAGRGFCVGGDAEALAGHARKGGYDPGTPTEMARPGYGVSAEFDASFAYHYGLSKPVIAAMNGPAAGVGLALACFADIRIAAAGANFTTAHGKLLLLTSRKFAAEEALQLGLVNKVVPADQVLTEAVDYARTLITTVSPRSLAETRRQIYRDLHRSVQASVDDSEALLNDMMRDADYAEGVSAFLEKRLPEWGKDKLDG